MKRVWEIAKREYLENVRTKAFLIGLILTPVWLGVVFLVPKLMKDSRGRDKRVVIVDETGVLGADVLERVQQAGGFAPELDPPGDARDRGDGGLSRLDELRALAGLGELYAIVLTPAGLAKKSPLGPDDHPTEVLGSNRSTDDAMRGPTLASIVNDAINVVVARKEGVSEELLERLQRPAVSYLAVNQEGEASTPAFAALPLVMMLMLFMGIVGISQMLVSNTIEEKANRVYEVLLSSVSPIELMTGKILGICGVGFTLVTLWSVAGLLGSSLAGMEGLISGGQVVLFLAYYVLGFLLISSCMVAVGSACNTIKEAQNLMAPMSVLLAMPLFLSMIILRNPNGTAATVASFIPPFTPFMMMARISSVPPPPTWQIVASLLLLVVSTVLAMRIAGRVFRTGVLLYGQPPSLSEIWRWMRTAD